MPRWPNAYPLPKIVISPLSFESMGGDYVGAGIALNAASTAWQAANRAYFVPFTLNAPATLQKMGWFNEGTVSGNVDVGIYDSSKTLVVNKGSTAQSGTSAMQTVTMTATTLDPGRYWLAMAMDNATGIVLCGFTSFAGAGIPFGLQQAATAFPLPTSPTFANPSLGFIPIVVASFTSMAVL